ncbi:hypothetical protein HPB50_022264 [Hyalomma asiaticum]|uniref:Uncharacterized protein n=1 Tax=Hyalomma asiaticum TaxID=266040 RepID=A0ACB7T3Y6_HYAAI|nr:hypothetical protein HPB50_022264 [Hyalomma asiaticum]
MKAEPMKLVVNVNTGGDRYRMDYIAEAAGFVARANEMFKLQDVEPLLWQGIKQATAEKWKSYVEHALNQEDGMRKLDRITNDVDHGPALRIAARSNHGSSGQTFGRRQSGQENGMLLANWDPMRYANEEPSPTCLLRVKRDIADIKADPLLGIFISPDESDMDPRHRVGTRGDSVRGRCPAAYPIDSPRVRLMTTDAGRVRFNRNLFNRCSTRNPITTSWDGARPEASKLYNERVQNDTIRVAICDAVEGCLKDKPPCPGPLAEAILKVFAESYDKYEQKVRSLIKPPPVQPAVASSQIPGVACTPPSYEALLARLQELYKRVRDRTEDQAAAQTAAQATLQETEQASG